MNIFISAIVGLVVTGAIFWITEYYTSTEYGPVKHIAQASKTGHATNVIAGLGVSMKSTAAPVIVIAAGIIVAFQLRRRLRHRHCRRLHALPDRHRRRHGRLRADHRQRRRHRRNGRAGRLRPRRHRPARRSGQHHQGRHQGLCHRLRRSGRDHPVHLLRAGADLRRQDPSHLSDPYIIVGLFIGGMLPYYFAALCMEAVGKAGGAVVDEVRRQFRDHQGDHGRDRQAGLRRLRRHRHQNRSERDGHSGPHPDPRPDHRRLHPRARRPSAASSSAPSSPVSSSPSP